MCIQVSAVSLRDVKRALIFMNFFMSVCSSKPIPPFQKLVQVYIHSFKSAYVHTSIQTYWHTYIPTYIHA